MKTCREFYQKYREAILYLVFGGLTTLVNYLVYALAFEIFPTAATALPNLLAWVVAVLFAYVTNRTLVFGSKVRGVSARLRELLSFAGARVATLLLETAILYVAVDRMRFPNLLVKLLANVLVVVLNYLLSKFWIFRKGSAE